MAPNHLLEGLSEASHLDILALPEEQQAILRNLWVAEGKLQAYGAGASAAENESTLARNTMNTVQPQNMTAHQKRITAEYFVRHPSELDDSGDDGRGADGAVVPGGDAPAARFAPAAVTSNNKFSAVDIGGARNDIMNNNNNTGFYTTQTQRNSDFPSLTVTYLPLVPNQSSIQSGPFEPVPQAQVSRFSSAETTASARSHVSRLAAPSLENISGMSREVQDSVHKHRLQRGVSFAPHRPTSLTSCPAA
ncbi:hypothetical protein CH63R_03518 [Colletotrichum higginsianum IMI 349063]|uniref:Uncharacterized protein n=2 Tax=Colletotrichum higginsianum (strain IMI 349063) TaxID=759273 RepID=A0A1B7YS60_COLHI|nr:hypothetical protein CH63R_03518 [Colletotrichum higginsianum IMI 349063]OBR14792.1 hypothetical protein CH63R_03518 [Colletotrichum higginsianum IMI 349063]